MKTVSEIQKVLRAALGSEALFSLVSTRVMLQTGVDLTRSDENHDDAAVQRVLSTLSAMGYTPASLTIVAQRRG